MASILSFQHLWRVLLWAAASAFTTVASAHEAAKPAIVTSVTSDPTAFASAAKAVDAFHAALVGGDRDSALALLADDVQIFEQGWVERSKAEYAAHHLSSDIEFSAAVASAETGRTGTVAGPMAYVSTEARMTGTFKGKSIDSISLETVVLLHTANGWRVTHIHWSSRDARK